MIDLPERQNNQSLAGYVRQYFGSFKDLKTSGVKQQEIIDYMRAHGYPSVTLESLRDALKDAKKVHERLQQRVFDRIDDIQNEANHYSNENVIGKVVANNENEIKSFKHDSAKNADDLI